MPLAATLEEEEIEESIHQNVSPELDAEDPNELDNIKDKEKDAKHTSFDQNIAAKKNESMIKLSKINSMNDYAQSTAVSTCKYKKAGSIEDNQSKRNDEPTLSAVDSDEGSHEALPSPLSNLDRNVQHSTPGAFHIPGIHAMRGEDNDNDDETLNDDASSIYRNRLDHDHEGVVTAQITTVLDQSRQDRMIERQEQFTTNDHVKKSMKQNMKDFWIRMGIGLMITALAIVVTVIVLELTDKQSSSSTSNALDQSSHDDSTPASGDFVSILPSSTPSLRPSMVPTSLPTVSLAPSQSPTSLGILAVDNLDRENFREWKVFSVQWGYYFGECQTQLPPRLSVECLVPDDKLFVLGQDYNATETTCDRVPGRYDKIICRSSEEDELVRSYDGIWMFACASQTVSPPSIIAGEVFRASWTDMEGDDCGLKSDYDLGPTNEYGFYVAMEPVASTSLRVGVVCFDSANDSKQQPHISEVRSSVDGCSARLYLSDKLDGSFIDHNICVNYGTCSDPLQNRNETCQAIAQVSNLFGLIPPIVNTSCFWQRDDDAEQWNVTELNKDLQATGYELSNYSQRVHEMIHVNRKLWHGLPP